MAVGMFFSTHVIAQCEFTAIQDNECDGDGIIRVVFDNTFTPPYNLEVTYPNGNSNTITTSLDTFFLNNLVGGLYVFEVTTVAGDLCVGNVNLAEDVINTNFVQSFANNGYNLACYGDCDAQITLNIFLADPNQLYSVDLFQDSISSGQLISTLNGTTNVAGLLTNLQFNNLCAGQYEFQITSPTGCQTARVRNVTQPDSMIATANITNVLCNGESTGEIDVTITGGVGPTLLPNGTFGPTQPYTYSWSNTATTEDLNGVPGGTYDLTVTDDNNCILNQSFSVLDTFPAIGITVQVTDTTCFGEAQGEILVSANGGVGNFEYRIDGGVWQSANTFTGLSAGLHTVDVRDANNCIESLNFGMPSYSEIVTTTNFKNDILCQDSLGSFELSTLGGTGPYNYILSPLAGIQNGNLFTNLPVDNYTLQISDANNCPATYSESIIEEPPLLIMPTVNDAVCFDGDGNVQIEILGGSSPFTISVDGSVIPDTFFLAGQGTYVISVIDLNNCPADTTVTINQPTDIILSQDLLLDAKCFGTNDGAINLTTSGGDPTGPYTYTWFKDNQPFSQNSEDITNLGAGSYDVIASNIICFSDTFNYIVNEPTILQLSFDSIKNLNCNQSADGYIQVSALGGTAPYQYQWSGLSSSSDSAINNLDAGTYTITITDDNNCDLSQDTILDEPLPLSYNEILNHVQCFGDSTGGLFIQINGGNNPFNFSLTPNIGQQGSTPITYSVSDLPAGEYIFNVADQLGCTLEDTLEILQNTQVTANFTNVLETCNADNAQSTASISGGQAPYDFVWTGQTSTDSILSNISGGGTYSLEVTDAVNCVNTFTTFVGIVPSVTITNVQKVDATCSGQFDGEISIEVAGGTAPFTYTISNTAPVTTNNTSTTFSSLPSGNYTVQVEDASGCVIVYNQTIVINQPSTLSASINTINTFDTLTCDGDNNGKIYIDISGGTTFPGGYYWLFVNDPTFSQQLVTDSLTGLAAGTYTFYVQDANNCLISLSHEIIEPDPITSNEIISNTSCFGTSDGSVEIQIQGGNSGYLLNLTPNSPNITPTSSNTFSISGIGEGMYFYDIIDDEGCELLNESFYVSEPDQLEVLNTSSSIESCLGYDATANVIAEGGTLPYTYSWTYDVNFQQPIENLDGSTNFSGTTSSPQNLTEGLHYIHIWDFNGCYTYDSVMVNRATSPTLNIIGPVDNLCNGDSEGQISANATGGTPIYVYSLDGGLNWQNLATFVGLPADLYNVTVRDSLGCISQIAGVQIFEPNPIDVSVSAQTVSCTGDSDGSASVILVQGGTVSGDYSYMWKNENGINLWPANLSANTSTVNNLFPGNYLLEVTDDNDCSSLYTPVVIGEPLEVNVELEVVSNYNGVQISCNGNSDGIILATGSGGTGDFNFEWTNSSGVNFSNNVAATFDTVFNRSAGTYSVQITDVNGCSNDNQVTISEPSGIDLSFINVSNISCVNNSDGQATVNWSGGLGFGNYTVQWVDESNQQLSLSSTVTDLSVGTYYSTVIDNNGCSTLDSITIDDSDVLRINNFIDTISVSCVGAIDATHNFNVSGGIPPYTFSWNDPLAQISEVAFGLAPGQWYTNIITDASGCVVYDSVYVDEPENPVVIDDFSVEAVDCFGEQTGSISISITGGTPFTDQPLYTYSWIGPEGYSSNNKNINNLIAGEYSVVVSDSVGCETFASYNIEQPDAPLQVNAITTTNVLCHGDATGTAEIDFNNISGGTGDPEFFNQDWDGLNPTALVAATNNIVTVTDDNGCNAIVSYNIYQPEPISATFETIDEYCQDEHGQILVNAEGGKMINDDTYNFSIVPNYRISGPNNPGIIIDFPNPAEDAETVFQLTIEDDNGCELVFNNVEVHPARMFDYNQTINVCYGDTVEITTKYNTYPFYNWSISSNDTILAINGDTITFISNVSSVVTVEAISSNGCAFTDEVNIVNSTPQITLGDDVSLLRGESIVLSVSGEAPYSWSTAQMTQSIEVSPVITTHYVANAFDPATGCVGSDTIRVFVGMNEGFSPNDDGYNDVWKIDYLNQYENTHIELYNRWGKKLWESDSPNIINWDGKYNGEDVPVGSYYYIITMGNGNDPITGPVTIVR